MSKKTNDTYTFIFYVIIFIASLYCVWILVDDYSQAKKGYPSGFDYQGFDLSSWIQIILIGLYLIIQLGFKEVKSKGFNFLKVFFWVCFFMVSIFDDWINEYRYFFPLFEIETIQIDATLNERIYLHTHPKSDYLYPHAVQLTEFHSNYFKFNGKGKLRKVINSVKTDTLFIDKGSPITIRLRESDYNRILNGGFKTYTSSRGTIEGSFVQIYELEYRGNIVYRYDGIK